MLEITNILHCLQPASLIWIIPSVNSLLIQDDSLIRPISSMCGTVGWWHCPELAVPARSPQCWWTDSHKPKGRQRAASLLWKLQWSLSLCWNNCGTSSSLILPGWGQKVLLYPAAAHLTPAADEINLSWSLHWDCWMLSKAWAGLWSISPSTSGLLGSEKRHIL